MGSGASSRRSFSLWVIRVTRRLSDLDMSPSTLRLLLSVGSRSRSKSWTWGRSLLFGSRRGVSLGGGLYQPLEGTRPHRQGGYKGSKFIHLTDQCVP